MQQPPNNNFSGGLGRIGYVWMDISGYVWMDIRGYVWMDIRGYVLKDISIGPFTARESKTVNL